jgi:transcriptional antiterminator NusG
MSDSNQSGDRFRVGEPVRIKGGAFEGFDGTVAGIDDECGKVTVTIEVFGRSSPVELLESQIGKI